MGMRCDGVDVLGKQQGDDAAATVTLSGVSVEVETFRSRLPQLATRQAHEPPAALSSPLARGDSRSVAYSRLQVR